MRKTEIRKYRVILNLFLMDNFKKGLSIVELEERHEMSTLALEDYSATEIERCEGRCRGRGETISE